MAQHITRLIQRRAAACGSTEVLLLGRALSASHRFLRGGYSKHQVTAERGVLEHCRAAADSQSHNKILWF